MSSCAFDGLHSSSGSSDGCEDGKVGCFCRPSGDCDGRLTCVSDRCVDLGTTLGNPSSASAETTQAPNGGSTSADSDAGSSASSTSSPGQDASEVGSESETGSCEDGLKNQQETDIDCGGPACKHCLVGQTCIADSDCGSQNCLAGRCAASVGYCEQDSDCDDEQPCTEHRCNAQHACEFRPSPQGAACDDANPCTAHDQCNNKGVCAGKDTQVMNETFSKAPYAFSSVMKGSLHKWEIARAKASSCASQGLLEDPAQDHTQDGVNQLMGVSVGGCLSTEQHNHEDCTWSEFVDVSGFDKEIVFSYWRHLSTPGQKLVSELLPMVTNSIYYRTPDGAPQVIETGWAKAVNDKAWTYIQHQIPNTGLEKVAFGICYRRLGPTGSFAGWSVDDVRVRQVGCEMGQ